MSFDQLPGGPQQARDMLLKLEQIVNEWDKYADAMPKPTAQLATVAKLADGTERAAAQCEERQRLDEALLGGFKEQVSATLGDARRAEQDYERRNELPAGAVPSAFFKARLLSHAAEVQTLTSHVKRLEAATSLRGAPAAGAELTPAALRELLQQQARLFEAAAGVLQGQHARTRALRLRVQKLLGGRDPCAEARNRKRAVRDKYKPADGPMPQLPAPPQAQAAAAPAAAAAGVAAPGAAPLVANPFGLAGAAAPALGAAAGGAANPFGAKPAAAAAPATGGFFGAAAPAPAASPFGAAPPAASPFGAACGGAAPAAGGLFGGAAAGATPAPARPTNRKKTGGRK